MVIHVPSLELLLKKSTISKQDYDCGVKNRDNWYSFHVMLPSEQNPTKDTTTAV